MTTEEEFFEPEEEAVKGYVTNVATLLSEDELTQLRACAQAITEQNAVMADIATKAAADRAADRQDEVNRRAAITIYFTLLMQGQIEQVIQEESSPES
ncbi:MAG TPA: hypothetical protein VGC87_23225 [Pyrinomonadaceae bacterium]|jgi:hypothetical protein